MTRQISTTVRLFGFVTMVGMATLLPHTAVADELADSNALALYRPCPALPDDATALRVQIESIDISDGYFGGDGIDRRIIESEAEYEELLGSPPIEIDWELYRVVIVQEYEMYRYRALEGEYRLSGVYLSDDTIIVRQKYANYGPCQGIAQVVPLIPKELVHYRLLIPREPTRISFSLCRRGDCPPDIP